MNKAFMEELGLTVAEGGGTTEATLPITNGKAVNPLTNEIIDTVLFSVTGDRLVYLGPPVLVGGQPISLAYLPKGTKLENTVVQTFKDHVFQLERRSKELSSIGVAPSVDSDTLTLSAELEREGLKVQIQANRAGQFRVAKAWDRGSELELGDQTTPFELSEFREKNALIDFVFSIFSEVGAPPPPVPSKSSPSGLRISNGAIPFVELLTVFGEASLPARSPMEMVCELKVRGEILRFAAARVQDRTFRDLLAGPKGKIWADRFDLDDFPGVREQVAKALGVPLDDVEVIS